MFFPENVVIFLNSASSDAALVFHLPGVCTNTDTKGKQRKTRVQNILKSLEKNTILNEHPVYEGEGRGNGKSISIQYARKTCYGDRY